MFPKKVHFKMVNSTVEGKVIWELQVEINRTVDSVMAWPSEPPVEVVKLIIQCFNRSAVILYSSLQFPEINSNVSMDLDLLEHKIVAV